MFRREIDLVENIVDSLKAKRVSQDFFIDRGEEEVFLELNLGFGIPDIVVTQYDLVSPEMEWRQELSYFDINVLKLIEKKRSATVQELLAITRTSKKQILSSLEKLLADEFVKTEKEDLITYVNYETILKDTLAIEAKLTSWGRALKQAYRYKWFSRKSFVFLPEEHVAPALAHLSEFQKLGVGLASVRESDGITIHYNPEASDPINEKMVSLLNERLLTQLQFGAKECIPSGEMRTTTLIN